MRNIIRKNDGVAAIEMAIILPLLLVIIMAVLEFGLYFLKEQAASRAVSTASIALQQRPTDGTIKLAMQRNGLGMMDFMPSDNNPNFVCAKAYVSDILAYSGSCTIGVWETNRPASVASGGTYYIAVRAFAEHTPLTPIRSLSGSFPPDIDQRNIVTINVASPKGMEVLTGSGNWTVPAGVTQIKATIIGGGGSGSGNSGSGGGGGGTAIAYIGDLVPGTAISYSVGAGSTTSSGNGGNTKFNNIEALGGGGGNNALGGASGYVDNVTPEHGTLKGVVKLHGQGGFHIGTGGISGGGLGVGAHSVALTNGLSGTLYGGGGGGAVGSGGNGANGGIIIEW